jgi:hypothetical protein
MCCLKKRWQTRWPLSRRHCEEKRNAAQFFLFGCRYHPRRPPPAGQIVEWIASFVLTALNTTPCGPISDQCTRIVWKKLKSRRSISFNPIQALFFATRKRVIPGINVPPSSTEKSASSSYFIQPSRAQRHCLR